MLRVAVLAGLLDFGLSRGECDAAFFLGGKPETFQIRYAVGHRPLQQYLVETANGQLQVLDEAGPLYAVGVVEDELLVLGGTGGPLLPLPPGPDRPSWPSATPRTSGCR